MGHRDLEMRIEYRSVIAMEDQGVVGTFSFSRKSSGSGDWGWDVIV